MGVKSFAVAAEIAPGCRWRAEEARDRGAWQLFAAGSNPAFCRHDGCPRCSPSKNFILTERNSLTPAPISAILYPR